MKILYCSPEVAPFAKTGGLADVSGALPQALTAAGVDCRVVMPLYRNIDRNSLQKFCDIGVFYSGGYVSINIWRHQHVYFIEHDYYFAREGYYNFSNYDYIDNLERFAFFSKACLELSNHFGDIDVIHCNDWQTALVPAYIYAQGDGPATVFTIHNIAYQGNFDVSFWPSLFLPQELFQPDCMEYYGHINVMKAGITLSNAVTTVSPSYAAEIRRPEFGFGLDGLLNSVSYKLAGIINGIDTAVWNPATDRHIARNYTVEDLSGKAGCKLTLQRELGLAPRPDAPLFGMISRMVAQKGCDMVLDIVPGIIDRGGQLAILGSGEPIYENRLRDLAARYPGQLGIQIGYNDALAHRIEAGSDFFLMPSRFEPCGLNQMFSMNYGTLPLVTPVGGLMDTVVAPGEGDQPCGFRILETSSHGLWLCAENAIRLYGGETFQQMRQNAMRRDFSWDKSAREYISLYKRILA